MKNRMVDVSANCQVELVIDDNGDFSGIGRIVMAGVPVRNESRSIQIRLDTPEGILYPRLELMGVNPGDDGEIRVDLQAHGMRWIRGEYGDDYGQANVWLSDSDREVVDALTLCLKPVTLELGGREWFGFAYRFVFDSDEREIHRLLVDATWEIGGSIVGNTVFSQGQCNMPVYHGERETVFTTACLRTLDQYGSPQGNSFQLGPRGGLIQGFDFQYSAQGALLQYWPDLDSISGLLESQKGSELLHIVDEYRFPLTKSVKTSDKHVLFCEGSLAEHEAHDLWWEAREAIYGLSRQKFGIAVTKPVPEIGMKYQTRVDNGRLRMNVGGEEVDSTEVPYAIAERILPRLAEQGIKRFFPEVMSESDVTVLGMKRKLDAGVHGDLHCASVCATHRFFPSEFWGGIKAWKAMADKAHQLDMEIGAWFAPHFSPRSPIYEEHPEYRMIEVSGLPAGGGYGFQTLVTADWNTPIMDWVLADLKRWKEEGGLDYLFTDSLSNLGLLQMNYSERMRTNYTALGTLFARIQALGIKSISCECISPWLVGRFGITDLRGDLIEQNRAVAGQNDFGWWVDNFEMVAGVWLAAKPRKRTDEEIEQFLFQAMACGGYINYEHDYGIEHQLYDWWARLNHVLNRAQSHMETRQVLPGRAGIRWQGDSRQVVWTFKDYALDVPAGADRIETLEGQAPRNATPGGDIVLPAWGVYVI